MFSGNLRLATRRYSEYVENQQAAAQGPPDVAPVTCVTHGRAQYSGSGFRFGQTALG